MLDCPLPRRIVEAVDLQAEQARLLRIKLDSVRLWDQCGLPAVEDAMRDCNFLGARASKVCFFTTSVAAETSVSTKIKSNHYLYTSWKNEDEFPKVCCNVFALLHQGQICLVVSWYY